MKLGSAFTVLGLTLGFASMAAMPACGDSASDDSSTGDKTPSGDTDAVGQPPAEPDAPDATSKDARTFALDNLVLGTDSATAKGLGYNVDGIVTDDSDSAADTSCVAEGKSTPLADGTDGRDNAFGLKLGATIKLLVSDIDSQVNDFIKKGTFTIMFDVTGLEDSATQSNKGLSAQLFVGADFADANGGASPKFAKGDAQWPVRPEFLKGADPSGGSKITFANAYVNNGVFVGKADEIPLSLTLAGATLNLTIRKATVTAKHDSGKLTDGIISGVLATDEVLATLDQVVGNINDGEFCETYKSNESVIKGGADILVNGTNAKGTCTGISVGLGFTAKEIDRPTKAGDPIATGGAEFKKCSER